MSLDEMNPYPSVGQRAVSPITQFLPPLIGLAPSCGLAARAVIMRVLDLDGREVHSKVKGDSKLLSRLARLPQRIDHWPRQCR
jgi:hypothetical protein